MTTIAGRAVHHLGMMTIYEVTAPHSVYPRGTLAGYVVRRGLPATPEWVGVLGSRLALVSGPGDALDATGAALFPGYGEALRVALAFASGARPESCTGVRAIRAAEGMES